MARRQRTERITTGKLGLRQRLTLASKLIRGKPMAISGTGFDITSSSRLRRVINIVAGIYSGADRHLTKYNLGKLRELCRAYDRQGSLFSGILDRALDNIVGANFDFIPTTGDKKLDIQVKDYISRRMEARFCDATKEDNFGELLRTTLRAVWNDGDNLLVKQKDGSVMTFEADQIETPTNKSGEVVLGVQRDSAGAATGYYVRQRSGTNISGSTKVGDFKFIPAGYAIFPKYKKRRGQTRGIPFLAVILSFFNRTNNYIDYESLAAEGNAMLGYKITKKPTEEPMPGVVDNEDKATGDNFEKLQKFEPFMIFELLENEDIEMIASQRPGTNFKDYVMTCLRIIGVGVGFPLELLLLDFSQTNYSSARASLGEARRMFRVWQKLTRDKICMPWYNWQIARGIALGELPSTPLLFKARCQWPAWEYIDPYKESMGNAVAISIATKTISECIRDRGGEPEEVFTEYAEDLKRLTEMGVSLPTVHLSIQPEKDQEEK